MNKPSKNAQQQSKFILEELEERRLFSGGVEGLIVTGLDADANAIYRDLDGNPAQTETASADAAAAEQRSEEIVFVDAGVDNYQQLVDDLRNNADSSRNIEVVVLDQEKDGIEEISEFLSQRDDLDAIHIISHGDDGSVELGNTRLNSETLEDNNLKIALWANSFAETGDILIYGCNLAGSELGQSLINELSGLTLTDVAASDDLTGHASLGGDWDLELNVGSIETAVAVSDEVQESWQAVLAVDAEDAFTGYPAGDLDGSGGGTGFTGTWSYSAPFLPTPNQLQVVTTGLTHPTSGPDTTDAVELNQTGLFDTFYSRTLASPYGSVDETIWASFLIQPQEQAGSGSYMGVVLGSGGYANSNQLFFGYEDSTFKMNNWSGGGTAHVAATPAVSGETAFVVLRLDISSSGNDTATLFVNPNSGEPTPSVSGTTQKVDLNLTNLDTITLVGGAVGSNPSLMGGLRIGSSFADVAPVGANDAPVFTSLDANPTFIEDGTPVVLDSDVTIFDAELSAADNFDGASLTLARNGGADAEDVYSATGTLAVLTEGGDLDVGGTIIGTVTTNSVGTLVLTFNADATNALVDQAMQQIAYSNSSDSPSASVQIDWSFDDGNTGAQGTGGALIAAGSTTVNITATNDAPMFIDGAFGNWNFDEGSGDSVAESAIGISVGTLGSTAGADANDPTWTSGVFGQALHFDGVDDYVEIADAPGIDISGPEFSASLWVKPDRGPGTEDMFFMKGDRQGIGNVNYYLSWKDTGKMTWAFKSDGGFEYIDMDVTLPTVDQWNHVAVVFDRPTVSIYINGTEYTSSVGTGGTSMDKDLVANDEPLWIGAGRDGGSIVTPGNFSAPFSGAIDELALFDRALTAAEIEAIRTSAPPEVTASAFSIDENSANNTVVGTVVASDPDVGDTLTYAITAGNTNGAFAIDNNGVITVANSAALDFETTPVFNLTVEATDDGSPNLSDTTVVTITLNNVAPTISASGAATVNEGELYTLNLSATEDVSSWTINWGDGTIDTIAGNPSSVTHTYTNGGFTNNITVAATDSEGTYFDSSLLVGNASSGTNGFALMYGFDPATGTADLSGVQSLDTPTPSNLDWAQDVVVGPNGNIYVSGYESQNIIEFDSDGNYIREIVSAPNGITTFDFGPDGNIYVASDSLWVKRYDGSTGAYIDDFLTSLSFTPEEIEFGPDGNLYIGDYNTNSRIWRYDLDGNNLDGGSPWIDPVNGSAEDILRTQQITWGPDGNIYVASQLNGFIQRYDGTTGAFIDTFANPGVEPTGWPRGPTGVAFGPDGNLYVVKVDTIMRFDGTTGAYIDDFVPSGGALDNPWFITFTPNQQVYVSPYTLAVITGDTSYSGNEGDAVAGDLNATDVDGLTDGTYFTVTTPASNGTAAIDATTGAWTYTPTDPNWFGSDSFTVTVTDDLGGTTTQAITITLANVNDPLTAVDDSYSVSEDAAFSSGSEWFDSNWSYSRTLSFDNSTRTENLVDFPVLVKLDSSVIDYAKTHDQGWDLRFFDQDGTALSHEVELWDEAGTSYVWVKIPQIDASSDTDSIVMYYGNAGVADSGEDSAGVWSDYRAAYHLDENPGATGTLADAAGSFDAVNAGSTDTAGIIGNAQDFDGAGQYIDLGDNRSWINNASGATLSIWMNADTTTGSGDLIGLTRNDPADTGASRITLIRNGDDIMLIARTMDDSSDSVSVTTTTNPLAAGSWHHITGTVDYASDVDNIKIYVDGELEGTFSHNFTLNAIPNTDSSHAVIGADEDGASAFFDGQLDEARIADQARSADWVSAQYAAMTGTLVDIGAEQTVQGVLINDVDADRDVLTVTELNGAPAAIGVATALPSGAIVTLNGDGSFTYDTNGAFESLGAGDSTTDSFTYTVIDGNGGVDTATVTMTVNGVNDAPTGTTLVVAATEETATAIDISGNVADVDGTVVLSTTTVTGGPSNGSLTNNGDGTFSYTGNTDFVGTDSFTYTVEDNDGQVSSDITVTINVSDVNDAPTGTTLVVAATEETATPIDISGNVSDVDGTVDLSTTTVTGGPSNGSLTNNGDGTFSYTGNTDFVGSDSFTYTVEDNDGQVSSDITVTINVSDVNDAPTGTTLVVAAVEETATAIDISGNVSDVDGTVDLTTTTVTSGPSNGSLTNNGDGTFSYTGNTDFVGTDSFTYTVEDNDGQVSSDITVTINVSDVNDAPTGTTLVVAAVEETATAIDISGNVADVDGTVDLTTTTVTSGPSNGSLTNNGDGTFSYTGNTDFVGSDSFTYTVEDNDGQVSSDITVTINVSDVNDAPTGTTLVVAAVEETATAIDISGNVSDVDGTVDLATTTVTSGPSNGSLINNGDGTFSYTGNTDFVGTDSFTYTVEDNDGQVSSDITVTINVSDVNDAPTGTTLVVAAVEETATAIDISGNVADVDGTVDLSTTTVTSGPNNGSLTNNGDGTFSYTGNTDFVGSDSFTYTVEDNDGQVSADITVTINVSDVNDAPTGTTLVVAAVEETATAIDISGNVSDVDGTVDLSTTTVTSGPSNGSLTNNGDGTFSYTGNTDFVGTDSFTYTVEDNDGQVSSDITVTINVSDVNDAPTGTTLVVAATEETATPIDISGNVSDVDGTVDLSTTTVTGGPSNGSLTNNGDGTFSYTGNTDFVGSDSFTYTVEDNDGQVSSDITVTINVSDVNDAPTGTTLVVAAVEETATAIDISGNVSDVDGTVDLTTTTVTSGPSNGSLTNNGDGTFSYTGNTDFVGTDSFTYTVEDNDGQVSSDITVTINVSDVNDAPTGTTLVVAAVEETATAIDISGNVADVDGTVDLTTTTVTSGPSNGSLTNNGDGTFSYTGNTDFVGTDSFTYTVEDNDGQVSSDITVTINVSDVNDAPTGTTLVVAAVEETATAIDISGNVSDVDGTVDLTTTAVTSGPANGSLTNNGDGTFSYTGDTNFVGTDSFTYTVEDNDGLVSSDITVTINVSDINDAPTGTTLVVAATEETATPIDISGNVSDVDGTVDLTMTTVTSGPSNGSLTNNGDGTFSYTGNTDFVGTDSFTYTVEDNDGQVSSDITVTINVSDVNDAPTGTTLVVAATEETATPIDISGNVSDVDGTVDLTTTAVTSGPANGSLTNNGDGTFSYTGNTDFVGTDSFTYTVEDNDGQVSSDITVTINVSDVNDAPTGTTLVVAATEETATPIDISGNVSDVDGTVDLSTTTVTSGPSNGSLTNNGDGTFSYTGDTDFVGTDSFTYTVEDNDGQVSSDITVTINVSDVNDAPVFDSTAVTAATEDVAYSYAITASDVDLETVTITAPTLPAWLTFVDNGDGTASLSGTPTNAEVGSHNVVLTVSDGTLSSNQNFTIVVANANDPAVIGGTDTGAVQEDVAVVSNNISTTGTLTITDPDIGESSFIAATINGSYGDLIIDSAGSWSYSADNSQISIQALAAGETLVDTLTVMSFDGTTHDVVITINGADDAPVQGGTATGNVAEDGSLTVSNALTITDTDASDNPIGYNDVGPALGSGGFGSFEMSGNTWTYTLDNGHASVQALDIGESMTDTFTFGASDGSTQTVTVTIGGAEDAPTLDNAISDRNAVEDTPFSFGFSASAFGDVDASDTLTYSATLSDNSPLPGWLSFDGSTRSFTGTPGAADIGSIDIKITADDGSSTVTDIFTLTVDPFNNLPLIGGVDSGTVTEDQDVVAGKISAAGALSITDLDAGQSSFVAQTVDGALGALTIDAAGNWDYSADNSQPEIQALRAGETIVETLTVTTADGSTHDIDITINGAPEVVLPPVEPPPDAEPPPDDEPPPEEERDADTGGGDEDPILQEITPLPDDRTPPPVAAAGEAPDVFADEEQEIKLAMVDPPAAAPEQPQLQAIQDKNLSLDKITLQVSDDEALNEQYELQLLERIERMHQGMDSEAGKRAADNVDVEIIVGSTVSLTAGIVSWVLRGGSLLASLMSTVPLLNRFDPLPILKTREDEEEVEPDDDDDSTESQTRQHARRVDNMFSAKEGKGRDSGYVDE